VVIKHGAGLALDKGSIVADIPESLIQLGFAAACALYLIYFMTSQIKASIDANTNALIGLQLIQSELYKLLLQHDATVRGLLEQPENPSESHKQAAALYQQVAARLDQLQARIAELRVGYNGK
jgi:hypothetical protein